MININLEDEDFKIIQLTDLHISIKIGLSMKNVIKQIIELEKPDLIILTGDVFHRPHSEVESICLIEDFIELMDKFAVNYCFLFGNHDAELMLTKLQIYRIFMEKSKYFIGEIGPEDITRFHINDSKYRDPRIGNCWINLQKNDSTITQICLLDSGRYNNEGSEGSLTLLQKKFVEANYKQENGNLLIFFHIPLIQCNDFYKTHNTSGLMRERICYQIEDCGLYDWAILQKGKIIINSGHDHLNDYEIKIDNVHLNATPGLCFEEYNEDKVRGYRSFNISNDSITSNKRVVDLEKMEKNNA